jgi:carboxymethylenebutenolidase
MAYRALPAGHSKGTIVVAHEIFGLTPHIRSVCDRLALAGYAAVAPDLFAGELGGSFLPYTSEGKAEGLRIKASMGDAALARMIQEACVSAAPDGRAGVLGFCLGGMLAWIAAADARTACAVAYYPVGMERHLATSPQCPVLLHFGKTDPAVPSSLVEQVRTSFPTVDVCEYDTGHAFNRDDDAPFHAEHASRAWSRTLEFYAKTIR